MGIQLLDHSTHQVINFPGWVRNVSDAGEWDTLHQNAQVLIIKIVQGNKFSRFSEP